MSLNFDSMHELHLYLTITLAHSEALVIDLLSEPYRARSVKFTASGTLILPPVYARKLQCQRSPSNTSKC